MKHIFDWLLYINYFNLFVMIQVIFGWYIFAGLLSENFKNSKRITHI